MENDQNLDYEVGEEIEGGITLPDFIIWMKELPEGQHQEEDGQVQHRDDQGDGGQDEGAVRKAVIRIENGLNFKKMLSSTPKTSKFVKLRV